ncbi:MAG: hypothetical protein JWN78_622 [Bacteroidota bacterium]|nr:hypothetical protein [Bacteroidota bacterium]
MMKSGNKFIMLFVFTLLFFGCKKTSTTNVTNTPPTLVSTLTFNPSGIVDSFYYDSLNRISRSKQIGNAGYTSYVYKGSDSVIVYAVASTTDSSRSTTYKINSAGLVSVIYYNTSNSSSSYTYDANGYPLYVFTTSSLGSATDTFVISSGNISEHRSQGTNVFLSFTQKQTYTFITDKTNSVNNASRGMPFFGKSNTNPISTEIFHSVTTTIIPFPSTNTVDETYSYTYEYNSAGRVTKITKTTGSSGAVNAESYTYY